jgi:hypothetical protein
MVATRNKIVRSVDSDCALFDEQLSTISSTALLKQTILPWIRGACSIEAANLYTYICIYVYKYINIYVPM